jgi:hypothetical protein
VISLIIQTLQQGHEEAAFALASTELLPHLIHFTTEPSTESPPPAPHVASKGSHENKKRLRESTSGEEIHPQEDHSASHSHSQSFLSKYLTPPQYLIIEKLLRDVISLFAIDHTPPSHSSNDLTSRSPSESSLQALNRYFGSNEYLELVSDSVNLFLLQSLHFSLPIPTHHTAIELCLNHSSQMKETLGHCNQHNNRWSFGSARTGTNFPSSVDYELHPVVWTSPPLSKRGQQMVKGVSGSKKAKKK